MNGLEDAWRGLDQFKHGGFAPGYPENFRRLYSPVDDPHHGLLSCLKACGLSLAFAMFGYDDAEVNQSILHEKLEDEHIPVSGSLDSTQALMPHEVPLIKEWGGLVGNSLSIGHSSRPPEAVGWKAAITHLKTFCIDGILTIGGSTNLSDSGQHDQDNEMIFVWDAVVAAETRARLDRVHDGQLEQMAKKQNKLIVDYAAKRTQLTPDEKHKLEAGIVPA
jgi:phosphatidylserine/phosphatidylglycerophosphate/cardiolipin synthase-like enzyme